MAENVVPKVTIVETSDWQALYVDGKLKLENHNLSLVEVLGILGIIVEGVRADEKWLDDRGNLPENLEAVKPSKRQ